MRFYLLLLITLWISLPTFTLAAEFVIAEGEQFQPLDDKGWVVTHQDNSWASHTYGGMWVSHGGLMGAPANSVGSVAVQQVTIPVAGRYRIWSRYQAPPYFNYLHQIEVRQGGTSVYSHVYGRKETVRQWSFGGVSDQLWWSWGTDHDAAEAPNESAPLQAGPAEIRLITVPNQTPAGDVMVDLVVLTTDLRDEACGPRGTLFITQAQAANRLYLRFRNTTGQAAKLHMRRAGHYQPLSYVGANVQVPEQPVESGLWSEWVNIGPFCMLVHDEGVFMSMKDASTIAIQMARDPEGKDRVGDFVLRNGEAAVVPIDIIWNKKKQVFTTRQHSEQIIRLAKTEWRTANSGRKPKQLLYFGRVNDDPDLKDALGYNTLLPDRYDHALVHGYHQHAHNQDEIKKLAEEMQDKASFKVLSFGDESNVSYEKAREMTLLAKQLIGPQVETGINYTPHYPLPQYYGCHAEWVDIFKKGDDGLTMFWTEDYLFSVPQPPQTISWMFAIMHCATKYHHQLIHMYIMPHAPGQIPEYLRRNMVFSIGAGARHIDQFCVAPAERHTENFVSWTHTDSFRTLHESIFDSAEAEPYQVNGKLRADRVALVLSRATDTNESKFEFNVADDPFMSQCLNAANEKSYNRQTLCRKDQQMLYLALKHAQYNINLITEDDIVDGYLKEYDVVYLAGEWLDQRVIPPLDEWVESGGVLYATAGIGHLNAAGEKNDPMLKLLGLRDSTIEKNVYILRPYLEMVLVEPIDTITLDGSRIPAIGIRQVLLPDQASVIGTWADGTAAVTVHKHGRGTVYAVGTLAGSTYIKSALRTTPWARGGRKMVYNPTEFDPAAVKLVRLGVDSVPLTREIECSNHFVEGLVIDSEQGTLITLVNWDNIPLTDLKVRVRVEGMPSSIRSVQQQRQLEGWDFSDGVLTFSTDLEWADYFLLPK